MARPCTVCGHPDRQTIDELLISGTGFRNIAERFQLSLGAISRHNAEHLPTRLIQAKAAEDIADADDLLVQLQDLRTKALQILAKAESAGDLKTALLAIRETRATIELLAELEGRLANRKNVNIIVSPEWSMVRAAIFEALRPHPTIRVEVAERLAALGDGSAG